MLKQPSSLESSMNVVSTEGISSLEIAPKAGKSYCVEEEETDSGSSSVGDEEVSMSYISEEEADAVSAPEYPFPAVFGHSYPHSQQLLSLERALEPPQQKPARTKLSSNALVFVPGASTTSLPNTVERYTQGNSQSGDAGAGRDILCLLKGKSASSRSEIPSDSQQKTSRSKLSSSAQVFVPSCFNAKPNVVQTAGFNAVSGNNGFANCAPPMVQLLPTLMIPMCTTSMCTTTHFGDSYCQDGFDDSPRAAFADSPIAMNYSINETDATQDPSEEQDISQEIPPKVCWADLQEDEEEYAEIWLQKATSTN